MFWGVDQLYRDLKKYQIYASGVIFQSTYEIYFRPLNKTDISRSSSAPPPKVRAVQNDLPVGGQGSLFLPMSTSRGAGFHLSSPKG